MINGDGDAKKGGDWQFAENNLILKSQIICITLSMAGIEKMNLVKGMFDYLIVDEACQSIEPSCLIPF
jgi:superfamily I DNA and/or RNA helicase